MTGQRHAEVTLPIVELNQDTTPDWAMVTFICMTQLPMTAGLKQLGKKGEDAVSKELNQLHLQEIFEPVDSMQLSSKERKKVMESHLFLKHKRDDSIKGRMVVGGNKQRGTIDKVHASSPTVLLEPVLLTSRIDAKEWREVATINIPNAFVQTKLENKEEKGVMRLRGKLADLMVKFAWKCTGSMSSSTKKGKQFCT
jgi:hypothetical protein